MVDVWFLERARDRKDRKKGELEIGKTERRESSDLRDRERRAR